jgi:hypothetical protein
MVLATTRSMFSFDHSFWQYLANASSSLKICARQQWISSAMIKSVGLARAADFQPGHVVLAIGQDGGKAAVQVAAHLTSKDWSDADNIEPG